MDYWKFYRKREIDLENHIVNTWKMEFLNCVVNLEMILQEYYIFSIMREEL